MRNAIIRRAALLLGVYVATLCLFYGARAHGQAAAPGPVGEAIIADRPHYQPCIDRDGPGPAPCVADPLASPAQSVDTLATAQRVGWSCLALVIVFIALVLASRWVRYLREGRRALYIASGTAIVAAAANASLLGGNWLAVATAAGTAFIASLQPDRTAAALTKRGVVHG